ncbi:uncharacterized protein SPSK_10218 [Sporothrix schenckii 1099-18]|uniref:Uncharacterized protein n=1 Tax=Sporothrix schenckii 1099-18 TaxID=1397361 RepID=A0A0F2M8N8_SPOSC|nr:uncharacterized protein SPSK_10218 [Sporothrix schenckii 1099-18]KJR85444.1 hypothetical protein SPSK_10218 [Sporothrix schenckii 1099-18]
MAPTGDTTDDQPIDSGQKDEEEEEIILDDTWTEDQDSVFADHNSVAATMDASDTPDTAGTFSPRTNPFWF